LQNYLPKSEVTFTNLSLRGNSFLWEISSINDGIVFTDTSANPKVHFSKAGLYSVKLFAYSKDGCVDSITFVDYISVIADGQVYVPNAFSPNNDKINDQFKPDGFGVIVDDYEFKVYDRWGELIFESHDPEVGWDGTYNTKECPEDTYVWSVQGRYVNHQGMRKKGTVILVR
jgi:gliding motility-associated-like protein